MIYSEAAYFDGYHFQHIADWLERKRIERLRREAQKVSARRQKQLADEVRCV